MVKGALPTGSAVELLPAIASTRRPNPSATRRRIHAAVGGEFRRITPEELLRYAGPEAPVVQATPPPRVDGKVITIPAEQLLVVDNVTWFPVLPLARAVLGDKARALNFCRSLNEDEFISLNELQGNELLQRTSTFRGSILMTTNAVAARYNVVVQ